MTKNQISSIAKFIGGANSTWSVPRFFFVRDEDPSVPLIRISSDSPEVLVLVSTINTLFCGVVVEHVISDDYKFSFEIFF